MGERAGGRERPGRLGHDCLGGCKDCGDRKEGAADRQNGVPWTGAPSLSLSFLSVKWDDSTCLLGSKQSDLRCRDQAPGQAAEVHVCSTTLSSPYSVRTIPGVDDKQPIDKNSWLHGTPSWETDTGRQ